MPEVDDNRYDTLKEAVKTLYDERMVEIDKVKADYTKQLSDRSGDLPKDETDEAMNKLEELTNQYSETCKTYRDNKEQEIEESHQKWLVNQAEERLNRLHGNKE
jgi:ribosome recycling factor